MDTYSEQDEMAALDYADHDSHEETISDAMWEAYWDSIPDPEERNEDNACPECDSGIIVAGVQEWETGHIPYECSAGCGWED